jgi:hypothetical protein
MRCVFFLLLRLYNFLNAKFLPSQPVRSIFYPGQGFSNFCISFLTSFSKHVIRLTVGCFEMGFQEYINWWCWLIPLTPLTQISSLWARNLDIKWSWCGCNRWREMCHSLRECFVPADCPYCQWLWNYRKRCKYGDRCSKSSAPKVHFPAF